MSSELLRRSDVLTVIWKSSKTMNLGPFGQGPRISEEIERACV